MIEKKTVYVQQRTGRGYFMSKWLPSEVNYLRDNYAAATLIEMATHLQRAPASIHAKAWALGLRRTKRKALSK